MSRCVNFSQSFTIAEDPRRNSIYELIIAQSPRNAQVARGGKRDDDDSASAVFHYRSVYLSREANPRLYLSFKNFFAL